MMQVCFQGKSWLQFYFVTFQFCYQTLIWKSLRSKPLRKTNIVMLYNWKFKTSFLEPLGEIDPWVWTSKCHMYWTHFSFTIVKLEDDEHRNPQQIILTWCMWELLATAFWGNKLKMMVIIWKGHLDLGMR